MSLSNPPPVSYELGFCTATGPFDFTDVYLDVVWSPITGPTVVQLLRAVNIVLLQAGGSVLVEIDELSSLIGVAPSRFVRSVERAERFGLLRTGPTDEMGVPSRLHAPLPHQMKQLSLRSREAANFWRSARR